MTTYVYMLVPVALLLLWYAFYFRRVNKAGGRMELYKQQLKTQFGLADGEEVQGYPWIGHFYLGKLRPDYNPGLAERAGSALVGYGYRGKQIQLRS